MSLNDFYAGSANLANTQAAQTQQIAQQQALTLRNTVTANTATPNSVNSMMFTFNPNAQISVTGANNQALGTSPQPVPQFGARDLAASATKGQSSVQSAEMQALNASVRNEAVLAAQRSSQPQLA